MDKVSIHIKIADRTYPLKVEASEAEMLKKSGKILNLKIKDYQKKFGIDDIQDLLAMVAFDTIVSENRKSSGSTSTQIAAGEKIDQLSEIIDSLKIK